ncbi:MAG: hypothetical protein CME26_08865 [Gemmatimonadetes bacterium]|nr:hypothetical protein [Gemmatimonadota bacterium]
MLALSGEGNVVAANQYACDLTSVEDRRVVPFEVLFEKSEEMLSLVRRGLEGTYVVDAEIPFESADSGHLVVSTSALDLDGNSGLVVVLRDRSDLGRSEGDVYQVEKMNALGRLAATVAHEVRNPLGAVTIQLQLMAEDIEQLEPELRTSLQRRLSVANTEIKRLDGIVGNFLRFSRSPQLELAPLGLNDVVRRVFDLVAPEAREYGVRLKLELADELPLIEGDESQLGQALLNLTVNAFHAIEGGGTVRAATSFDRPSGMVRLALKDDGRGIDPVDLSRIFELYYTTKAEGTGLGLSIAQRVIYEHGGSIDVQSEPGVGSTFAISLPRSGGTSGDPGGVSE